MLYDSIKIIIMHLLEEERAYSFPSVTFLFPINNSRMP